MDLKSMKLDSGNEYWTDFMWPWNFIDQSDIFGFIWS